MTLASEASLQEHVSKTNTQNLATLGFNLVESQEARRARTLLAFRFPKFLTERIATDLAEEIPEKNNVQVEEIALLPTRTPILKFIVNSTAESDSLLKLGVGAFSVIIPPPSPT